MYFLANLRQSDSASAKSDAGIGLLKYSHSAHDTRLACFLFVRSSYISMVGWAGASQDAPVPCDAGKTNSVQFTTSQIGLCGGEFKTQSQETSP
ncbi:TPA: ash family protein [Serratia marcescens]|nr:ash family protein [Serratia marcescens]